jgi:NAD-dependent deacetylase
MIISSADEGATKLAELVSASSEILGFTGAGISTECGVPDFRSPGSPWMVNKPIPFDDFVQSEAARQEAWRRKFTMDDHYADAKPGRGHKVLADLHQIGLMPLLITQNIDGLHQKSGLPADAVVELHGNGTYATCLACCERHELPEIRPVFETTGSAPACRTCGGLVKSATISFGQAMPKEAMRRAEAASRRCDLFLAIGSSLVVYPAAALPLIGKQSGAKLVILNREPTELDADADLVIRADIGTTLARMAGLLPELLKQR